MFAMQYEITLPADYDMAIIHRRVAERGHLLDDFPGLGLKAYLIQERGVAGAAVNQYAPFYLWPQIQSIWPFVTGPGFKGLTNSFGPVAIRSWAGLDVEIGSGFAPDHVLSASRQLISIDPASDLAALREDEAARQHRLVGAADGPALHATALDIEHWRLLRFALWTVPVAAISDHGDPAAHPEFPVTRYQVLHMSTPEIGALKGSTSPPAP